MRNPKTRTASDDVLEAVREVKAWCIECEIHKTPNMVVVVGKPSFVADKLTENIETAIDAVLHVNPARVSGNCVKSIILTAKMAPGSDWTRRFTVGSQERQQEGRESIFHPGSFSTPGQFRLRVIGELSPFWRFLRFAKTYGEAVRNVILLTIAFFKLALKENNYENLGGECFEGHTAINIDGPDPSGVAKTLFKFSKDNEEKMAERMCPFQPSARGS
jgi:hypothetical protein